MGIYWIALPRTLWSDREEYGVWDIVKDEKGYKDFTTIEEAKK